MKQTGPLQRTFGPVPSRRFGRSLGLNTIPPKSCTYSCIYCQVGRTNRLTLRREPYCDPARLAADVGRVLRELEAACQQVDYLTFVPDGEPTLDSGLAQQIEMLRPFNVPIAIITNATLLSDADVQSAVSGADRVSVKVDSVREDVWRRIDRPHGDLKLGRVLDGVLQFAQRYDGELDTETMLVAGVNDAEDASRYLASFLREVKPDRSYVALPTRPPAERSVTIPGEAVVVRTYDILKGAVDAVELLAGFEGVDFVSTGNAGADLLAITSVHPMRRDQVETFVTRSGGDMELLARLVRQGRLAEVEYSGQFFYVRRFGGVQA